jgi:hypothetical protein
MGRKSILGGLALLASAIAALPAFAAEPLTRSSCWTSKLDTGATRTMCFVGAGKVKMNNRNRTSDDKGWSSCEWTGYYNQTDAKVTVAFAPGSGKCSNRAVSPQWAANCDFSDDALDCQGSAIVDGKLYDVNLTFK